MMVETIIWAMSKHFRQVTACELVNNSGDGKRAINNFF